MLVVSENGSETLQSMSGEQPAQGVAAAGGIQMVSLNSEPSARSGQYGPLDRVLEDLRAAREPRLGETLTKEVAALVPLLQNQVRSLKQLLVLVPISHEALMPIAVSVSEAEAR